MNYLSVIEVAQLLNLKPSFIYSLVESRKISHYRLGRLLRLKQVDVEKWVEDQRQEAENVGNNSMKETKNLDLDNLVKKTVDTAKDMVYIRHHAKPNRNKGLRKEGDERGTL